MQGSGDREPSVSSDHCQPLGEDEAPGICPAGPEWLHFFLLYLTNYISFLGLL